MTYANLREAAARAWRVVARLNGADKQSAVMVVYMNGVATGAELSGNEELSREARVLTAKAVADPQSIIEYGRTWSK